MDNLSDGRVQKKAILEIEIIIEFLICALEVNNP